MFVGTLLCDFPGPHAEMRKNPIDAARILVTIRSPFATVIACSRFSLPPLLQRLLPAAELRDLNASSRHRAAGS